METVVDFIGKLSTLVRDSMKDTKKCIGKELVDISAGKKGLCIDRITNFYGTKISFLGVKYTEDELSKIEGLKNEVLVCQGKKGKFFVSMKDVSAIGDELILLQKELKIPEIDSITEKKESIYKRFYLTTEAIRDVLPDSVPPAEEKESKKWLKRLIGE